MWVTELTWKVFPDAPALAVLLVVPLELVELLELVLGLLALPLAG